MKNKTINIIGGGTFFHVRNHFSLATPAFGRPRECQLIQPTEKGYNFLDLHTSKCILRHHLYPYKKYTQGTFFFLYQNMQVKEIPFFGSKAI